MSNIVRFYADWQILGEVDGREYLDSLLNEAKADGVLEAYEIKFVVGRRGEDFFYTYFTADINVDLGASSIDELRKDAENLLNTVILDTDVSVRWFEFIS